MTNRLVSFFSGKKNQAALEAEAAALNTPTDEAHRIMDELARDWYNGYRSWEKASPEAYGIVKLWLETDRVLDPRVELFSSELAVQARFLRDRFARIRRVIVLVRPRGPELFRSNRQLEPVIGSFL
jgi:hypothetical protein